MKLIVENVLTKKERKKLIKDCKPFLRDKGPKFPGLQSDFVQREGCGFSQFESVHTKFLDIAQTAVDTKLKWDVSWFVFTKGIIENNGWHTHPVDYVGVYYMQTFPFFSNGTLFKEGLFKVPQNSLLIFPGHLEHAAPSSPLPFERYTLALNWNKYYDRY
jgi:hypothetical protein